MGKELVESGDVSPETASDVVEELHEDVKVTETPVAEELSGDSEKTPSEEEKPNDHDLLEVIEKLTEEVMNLKARVLALEDVGTKETVDESTSIDEEPKAEVGCNESEDEKVKARINNIFNSITMPQAVVANAPKAKNVVHKVDYKTYKAFINEY